MLTTTTMFLILLAAGLIVGRNYHDRQRREERIQSRLIRALRAEAAPGAGLLFRRPEAGARPELMAMVPHRRG